MIKRIACVVILVVAFFTSFSTVLAYAPEPEENVGDVVIRISASPDYEYLPQAGGPITIVTTITNTSLSLGQVRYVDSKTTIQGAWWGGVILPSTPDEAASSVEAMIVKLSSKMKVSSSEVEVYKIECTFAIMGCSFWWKATIQPGMSASLIIPTVTSGWIGIVEGAAHTETHVLGFGVIHTSLTLHGLIPSENLSVYGFFQNSPGAVVRASGDIFTSTLFLKNLSEDTKDVVLLLVADPKALTNPIIRSKPASLETVGSCEDFTCFVEMIGSIPPGDSPIVVQFNIGSSGYYYQGLGATVIVPNQPLSQTFSNIESLSRVWFPWVRR